MKALSVEELADAFLELQESGFQNYIDRVSDFLDKKEEWVQVFRSNLMHRGHETNNYAEASIRILKDIILGRTKAFNVPAMVDFIVSVWEVYFENRLLHYAYGRMAAPRLRYENLHDRMPDGESNHYGIQHFNPNFSGKGEKIQLTYDFYFHSKKKKRSCISNSKT